LLRPQIESAATGLSRNHTDGRDATRLPLPPLRLSALCDLNGVYLIRIGKHLFFKLKTGISAQALIVFVGT